MNNEQGRESTKRAMKTAGVVALIAVLLLSAGFVVIHSSSEPVDDEIGDCNTSPQQMPVIDTAETDDAEEYTVLRVERIKSERSTDVIETKVEIDFPQTDNRKLQEGITAFILKALQEDFTWGEHPRPEYHGNLTSGQAIADFFANDKVREISEQRLDDTSGREAWDEEIEIKKAYETNMLVSYEVSFSGCHGGVGDGTSYGVTFDKAEGRIIPVIKNAGNEHFKSFLCDYVGKHIEPEARELFSAEELSNHPFPRKAPYITEEGVCFIYQKYEIGAGAMGLVEITVPFEEMADYLSEESMRLIQFRQKTYED